MLEIGSRVLGRYEVQAELGRGSMGITYRALRLSDQQAVALKVLSIRGLENWKNFELFEREAAVLQRLDHPHIPAYLESFQLEEEGGPVFCLVQSLAPGLSVDAAMAKGWRPSEDESVEITLSLLETLSYLHDRLPPVLHRDIKPQNLVRDPSDGAVRLVDFGAVRDTIATTVGGGSTVVGTYGYMAPEQFRGAASPSSDVYAVAATLLFLLSGRPPTDFPSQGLQVNFREQLSASPALLDWLERALDPMPEQRFASAAEARDALRDRESRALKAVAGSAAATSSPRPNPVPVLLLGVSAALFVAGFSVYSIIAAQTPEPPQPPAPPKVSPAPKPPPVPVAESPAVVEPPPLLPLDEAAPPSPAGPLAQKWKSKIGLTTFRSTLLVESGHAGEESAQVWVNSNGEAFDSEKDPLDGVYLLNGPDGKVTRFFQPPGDGERDANGLALGEDFVVFGTDQEVLYKYSREGKLLWRRQLHGDPEAAPALADFNGDGVLDVAIGTETGRFYRIDGAKGSVLSTLRAGKGEYDQTGFLASAALADLSGDGVPEIFVPARDQKMRALDGASGKLRWEYPVSTGMHGSPIVVDVDRDQKPELIFSEAYSGVFVVDAASGQKERDFHLEHPGGGIEGLFSPLAWFDEAECVLVSTAWWDEGEGIYCLDPATGATKWRHTEAKGRISSGAVFGEVDGSVGDEAVIGLESGAVVALKANGALAWKQPVGGAVECTPAIADLDADGVLDLLVAANDGWLYAFATQGVARAPHGYVRGDAQNTGRFARLQPGG